MKITISKLKSTYNIGGVFMKKLALLLWVSMLLVACGQSDKNNNSDSNPKESVGKNAEEEVSENNKENETEVEEVLTITKGNALDPSAYIIRGIEASDARSFILLQEEIFQQTDFMYTVQNELDLTVQQLRKNLTYWKQLKNRTILLCVLNGIFAGYAVIHGYKQTKARHVASVRLAVKEEYQQKGIGSALMKAVEGWSKQRDISRLELSVMEHNNVALHLFTKLGFKQEGIRQNAIKLNDTYINEYNLSKIL